MADDNEDAREGGPGVAFVETTADAGRGVTADDDALVASVSAASFCRASSVIALFFSAALTGSTPLVFEDIVVALGKMTTAFWGVFLGSAVDTTSVMARSTTGVPGLSR
jgi:hypothetical protein